MANVDSRLDGDVIVGVVGLGNMGGPVAAKLIGAGYNVVVSDQLPERAEQLAALGARNGRLEDVAEADIALLFLPGPVEVLQVGSALIEKMRPGSYLVNLSTGAPETVRALAESGRSRGVAIVDAPVTGAADGAQDGSLTVIVGAEAADLEAVRPVLAAFSARIAHLGPVGAGTVVKLLTNMLWFISVVALCDALALGVKAGVDLDVLAELIPNTAGSSWAATHDLPRIVAGDDDLSFTLALCVKDLSLIGGLARDLAVPVPLRDIAAKRFEEARERFGDAAGELAVSRLTETAANVSLRGRQGATKSSMGSVPADGSGAERLDREHHGAKETSDD